MTLLLESLSSFFLYAIVAVFAQNAVFSRALGVSRLVKLVDDVSVSSIIFCGCLCTIQIISAPFAFLFNRYLLSALSWRAVIRPVVMLVCASIALGIVVVVLGVSKVSWASKVLPVLPMATFNCAILGCLFLTTAQNFTFAQTMGFSLGSGLGYTLAVMIVTEGQRKIRQRAVPNTFQGLPVTLLYIAVLALAIYGFTGHMAAI